MSGRYTRKHLLEALRISGLPCTYPTILKYERNGVIKPPQTMVEYDDRSWRFYTSEEIEENVERVKLHKKGKLGGDKD